MKTEIVDKLKDSGKEAAKFASATGGLIGGGFIGSKIPELEALKKIPGIGEYVSKLAPGVLLMLAAFLANMKFSDTYVKNAAMGVGMAGFLDCLRRTGLLAKITTSVPGSGISGLKGMRGLKGVGVVQNYGDYPPDFFMKSNWAGSRPLNGPYQLQGAESKAFSLQGPGGNKAFSLQGGVGCMFQ